MTPCIRCGKERVIATSYHKTVSKSDVTYTMTVCPDAECQKIVEKGFKEEQKKRVMLEKEKEQRLLRRNIGRKSITL